MKKRLFAGLAWLGRAFAGALFGSLSDEPPTPEASHPVVYWQDPVRSLAWQEPARGLSWREPVRALYWSEV